jgi:hypothetical protein
MSQPGDGLKVLLMIPTTDLWTLYTHWKDLTEREGQAILNCDWPRVRECQSAKQSLQNEIIRATDLARASFGTPIQEREFVAAIRGRVNELIQLETKNNSILEERLAFANQQKVELSKTSRRLRQVRHSYALAREPIWNSYS